MRELAYPVLLLASASLAGCATNDWKPPEISLDKPAAAAQPAVLETPPPAPVQVVEVPRPLPLPGQLQRVPPARTAPPEPADPRARVEAANSAARVQPFRSGWFNAVQVYRSHRRAADVMNAERPEADRDEAPPQERPRPEKDIAAELRLRPERPRVVRLSRKVLASAGAVAALGVGGALIWALQSSHRDAPQELYSTGNRQTADGLARLPQDYAGGLRPLK